MPLTSDDRKILSLLQRDGRMAMVELARQASMSETTCLRRTKSLEEIGVIEGYAAIVDAEAIGFEVTAFVQVSLHQNTESTTDAFKKAVLAHPLILECYSLSGSYDHLMKIIARNNKDLAHFVLKKLTQFPAIRDVQTLFVLDVVKRSHAVPVYIAALDG